MLLVPVPMAGGTSGAAVQYVDYTKSNATTITAPSSITAGDLLILFDSGANISPPAAVTPAGWTQAYTTTWTGMFFGGRASILYKVADGTEDGATITGIAVTFGLGSKTIWQYRADSPYIITGANWATPTSQGTDLVPTTQNVLAASGSSPVISFGWWINYSDNTAPTRTMTGVSADHEVDMSTPDMSSYMKDVVGRTNFTISGTDNGDYNFMLSAYVSVICTS